MASLALPDMLVDRRGRPGILCTPVSEDQRDRLGSG